MRPFALLSLALFLCGSTPQADAQMVCGPNGCVNVRSYGFGVPVIRRPVLQRRSVTYTPSTVYSAPSAYAGSTYTVSETGDIIAPDGGTVTRVGGVEVVAKQFAGVRSASAVTGSCQCNCGPELAEIKAQLAEIKELLKGPYREPAAKVTPTPNQSAMGRLEYYTERQRNRAERVALR